MPVGARGTSSRRGIVLATLVIAFLAVLLPVKAHGQAADVPAAGTACDEATLGPEEKVLLFTKTTGFRHTSIDEGVAAVCEVAGAEGIAADHTEDSTLFTDDTLAQYDAVVFLSTTGDPLAPDQQAAFERYIQAGGGFAGIHAASDTEYDWPWYGGLVGAYFESHPANQNATVKVSDPNHPSTAGLPQRWQRFDEWYNFQSNPRGDVHVLATLDESSYTGGADGADHPTAWCHEYDGGRSWYTGGGHTEESYEEPLFRDHILGGIEWAAGLADGECGGTVWDNFERITLAKGVAEAGEPIGLAVLPDRSVLHTSRDGTVYHTDAEGNTEVAADIPVYSHDEDGLQAITIDPGFASNHWVYVYYAPPLDTPPGDAPFNGAPADFAPYDGVNHLARFEWDPLTEELDLSTEQVLLEVDQDRGICCHNGGDFAWDAAGNLYLSTGDDTNPFESQGFAPIDERATRNPAFDAQRSAANTNDLRGKILRIKPDPASPTYTIPAGNLFAPGTPGTRPEIYAMGFRNPFRIGIDPATGLLYVGDYGPDAGAPDPLRGPGGQVEFNVIRDPGFYGWPYCHGDNDPYRDYDFATGVSGPAFNCSAPVNASPQQHRSPDPARARGHARHLVRQRRSLGGGDAAGRLGVADGGAGLPVRPREPVADEVPRVLRRPLVPRRVGEGLDQGDGARCDRCPARGQPVPRRPCLPVDPADGHGVRARRRPLRARLRRRLLRRRRQLGPLPGRLRAGPSLADRGGSGRSDLDLREHAHRAVLERGVP